MTNTTLDRELKTYKDKLPELKDQEGKFVLIQGEKVEIYGTYEDAVKAGYEQYGLQTPFLVKQIHAIEQVQFITRSLDIPCPT
jgi:hypothetical protein